MNILIIEGLGQESWKKKLRSFYEFLNTFMRYLYDVRKNVSKKIVGSS